MKKAKKNVYKNFTFKLAGRTWKVVFTDKLDKKKNPLLGYCDRDKAKIFVTPSQSESSLKTTFWHELFHAYTRNIIKPEAGTIDEEIAADCVGEGQHEVLKQIIKKAPYLI